MRPRLALALLLALTPAAARAEDAPERLLPAGTQLYVRWDGIDAHRAAYAQTGLGKMLAGDTGAFAQSLFRQLQDGLGALLTVDQLLGGVPPDKLALPSVVVPSMKVTVPVGVPESGALAVTVAVNVTDCP